MPSAPLRWPFLVLLAAAWWLWPAPTRADIRRCTGPDGKLIYTDRACTAIGATDRLPHTEGTANAPPPYRGGCSRRLRDLVQGLTTSIGARDANRLALYYDWSGMSTRQGYAVMERLDGIARRPLEDIAPLYASARAAPAPKQAFAFTDAQAPAALPPPPDVVAAPQPSGRRPLVALQLHQTFSGGSPVRTTLGVRKRLGCWWIRL